LKDIPTMKLSDLSDIELATFYVQANSYYAVKRFRVAGGEVEIQNINEIENEMSNRSIEYWHNKIKEAKNNNLEKSC
jgi:hypothetical protein